MSTHADMLVCTQWHDGKPARGVGAACTDGGRGTWEAHPGAQKGLGLLDSILYGLLAD